MGGLRVANEKRRRERERGKEGEAVFSVERITPLGTRWDDTYVSEWDECAIMPDEAQSSLAQHNIHLWTVHRTIGSAEHSNGSFIYNLEKPFTQLESPNFTCVALPFPSSPLADLKWHSFYSARNPLAARG